MQSSDISVAAVNVAWNVGEIKPIFATLNIYRWHTNQWNEEVMS